MIEVISNEEAQQILGVKKIDSKPIIQEVTEKIPMVLVKELPSGFKGYPEGTKISYSPITLGELESLNSGDMDIERGIAMLLNSIHCNTLPVEKLYYWDVMYIGIQRKLLAFGDTTGTIYAQCPNCGEIVERTFDFTELEFKELEAEDLPAITTICGKQVEIGLLTIKEFLELDLENGELDVYSKMIKNLPYDESFQLISNATGKDAKKIRFIDKKLNYGLKPLLQECNNIIEEENPNYDPKDKNSKKTIKRTCGEKVYMEVRSPFEVVFPEDSLDGCDDLEIQFGRK